MGQSDKSILLLELIDVIIMNKSKDNDQTFVIKILDDLRSNNRNNPLRMDYNSTLGLSPNDSLLSSKRRRSCSPDLEQSLISMFDYLVIKCILY